MSTTRVAVVKSNNAKQVEAYLPANYKILGPVEGGGIAIYGEDNAGWTLDGYVIPRLASGLLFAEEVTQKFPPHPFVPRSHRSITPGKCQGCGFDKDFAGVTHLQS